MERTPVGHPSRTPQSARGDGGLWPWETPSSQARSSQAKVSHYGCTERHTSVTRTQPPCRAWPTGTEWQHSSFDEGLPLLSGERFLVRLFSTVAYISGTDTAVRGPSLRRRPHRRRPPIPPPPGALPGSSGAMPEVTRQAKAHANHFIL